MRKLIGRKAKLNNVNPSLYKWKIEGIIDWHSDKLVRFEGSRALYSLNSIDLIDADKPPDKPP